jgi:hypothetical protein
MVHYDRDALVSVPFPDGTILSLMPSSNADRSATEVDRWFETNAS